MEIQVRALKHDGSLHLSYTAEWRSGPSLVIRTFTAPGTRMVGSKGQGQSGEEWHGHFWPDRMFNVIRYSANDRHPAGWYCNIAGPAILDGSVLTYVDYELDVRVAEGDGRVLEWVVLDEDEFEEARRRYGYDDDLVWRCRAAVDELISMVKAREFPFDA